MQTTVRPTMLIRHQGMRIVTLEEVANTLANDGTPLGMPIDEEVNTVQFSNDGDGVSWILSNGYLWTRAREIKERLSSIPGARLTYFGGYPEVAHAVALGAYLGEQWNVDVYDRHADGTWQWPCSEQTLRVDVTGIPPDTMLTAGPAVLRVEISATIEEQLIRRSVSETEEVAHVRVRPAHADPAYGERVQSHADLEEIRRNVRRAISGIMERRPNTRVIHLFIAAPASVCFVTGQELRIRNTRPVQTYRHRMTADGEDRLKQAMRLTPGGPDPVDLPLSDEEKSHAEELRISIWESALREVERYSTDKGRHAEPQEKWYSRLEPQRALSSIRPFPALPPIYAVIEGESSVDRIPMEPPNYYGYQRAARRWRVSDQFLLRLHTAFNGDLNQVRAVVRLFMFHEASHIGHGIVKGKVEEVGKFPNSLEYVDYTADLYAILHELDRSLRDDPTPIKNFDALKSKIVSLIDLVIRSFWAFDEDPPIERMETRRIRRYMNWYWQRVRIDYSTTPFQLAAILARKPIIEISGLDSSVESRRHYSSLRHLDPRLDLEIAVILDSEELWRIPTSVTVPIERLVAAFRDREHVDIQQLFRQIFENVVGSKQSLPATESIM